MKCIAPRPNISWYRVSDMSTVWRRAVIQMITNNKSLHQYIWFSYKPLVHSKKNPGKIPNCVGLHCFSLSSKGFIPAGLILWTLGIFPGQVRDLKKSPTIQFFLLFTMAISVQYFFLNPSTSRGSSLIRKGSTVHYIDRIFPLIQRDEFRPKNWISNSVTAYIINRIGCSLVDHLLPIQRPIYQCPVGYTRVEPLGARWRLSVWIL